MVQWREIAGFTAYEISDHGDVRRGSVVKKQMADRKGYRWVSLWIGGKSRTRYIAPMVAAAFIGPRLEGQQVRHKNGINDDNRPANLEYGTRSENELDKRRHGTAPIGENHPAAKLTQKQVLEIRARYTKNSRSSGCNALGKEYGITGHMVYRIVHRLAWDHLP
jgi:hypothetical protein